MKRLRDRASVRTFRFRDFPKTRGLIDSVDTKVERFHTQRENGHDGKIAAGWAFAEINELRETALDETQDVREQLANAIDSAKKQQRPSVAAVQVARAETGLSPVVVPKKTSWLFNPMVRMGGLLSFASASAATVIALYKLINYTFPPATNPAPNFFLSVGAMYFSLQATIFALKKTGIMEAYRSTSGKMRADRFLSRFEKDSIDLFSWLTEVEADVKQTLEGKQAAAK